MRWVEYTIPVLVEVDEATGHVSRVVEYNDFIDATGKVFAADRDTELPEAEAARILDLVSIVNDEWPPRESAN